MLIMMLVLMLVLLLMLMLKLISMLRIIRHHVRIDVGHRDDRNDVRWCSMMLDVDAELDGRW